METRKNNNMASRIRVRDMQMSLDFYQKMFGFRIMDKLTRRDGKIAHASVGFDSPVLMQSPVEYVRTQHTKDNPAENKFGIGVEFHIAMAGSVDEFFIQTKAKGIQVINRPTTKYWGDRVFTVADPDGYALTFCEHVSDVTVEARALGFENSPKK
jgi:uncharacterized glyoxalase superfamily protein PhnB